MDTIGSRIKKRRLELAMSQEELARKIGYKDRSSINKIENDGRNLTQSKIKLIANALDTTPGYIMGWDDETFETLSEVAGQAYWNAEISKRMNLLDDSEKQQVIDYIDFLILKKNSSMNT